MAKCPASRIVGNAEVRLSTDTSMVGGSAHRCVAESPSKPAGPFSERAVTIVLPVARWPIACQNCLMSIIPGASGMNYFTTLKRRSIYNADELLPSLGRQRPPDKIKLHAYANHFAKVLSNASHVTL